MVSNGQTSNTHNPPSEIGYKLSSLRSGSLRTFREHTKFDFWVTRTAPSAANRIADLERKFVEIADYVRNPEPTDGQPVAIWHTTALHHVPRTEDFGADGFEAQDGLAIMMWTGFDLMPHNLWDKTPLYPGIP